MEANEDRPRSPHDMRRRTRLAALCLCTAVFGLMLGYVANNVSGASQVATDYLPILFFGSAMLVTALGLLVAGIVQGGLWLRVACALVSIPVFQQLLTSGNRISEILATS